jgi:hypothetical protein
MFVRRPRTAGQVLRSCGPDLHRGETYLVYAHCHKQGDCFTIICSRTRPVEDAAEDLQYLATHKTLPLPLR